MRTYHQTNAGFTTVEVLVTLFVGALLLGGGYQLYSIIAQTNADSRNQIDASNIVYEQLRKYSDLTSGGCSPQSLTITSEIPSDNTLPGNLDMSLDRSCPFGDSDPVSQLSVTLNYGEQGARSEVTHVLYTQ